jgi:hypothetical protein
MGRSQPLQNACPVHPTRPGRGLKASITRRVDPAGGHQPRSPIPTGARVILGTGSRRGNAFIDHVAPVPGAGARCRPAPLSERFRGAPALFVEPGSMDTSSTAPAQGGVEFVQGRLLVDVVGDGAIALDELKAVTESLRPFVAARDSE